MKYETLYFEQSMRNVASLKVKPGVSDVEIVQLSLAVNPIIEPSDTVSELFDPPEKFPLTF